MRIAVLVKITTAVLFALLMTSCAPETSPSATEEMPPPGIDMDKLASGQPALWVDLEPASSGFGQIYLGGLSDAILDSESESKHSVKVYQYDTQEENTGVPQMLGTYTPGDGYIRFTPRFPLGAGLSYRVVLEGVIDTVFTVPELETRGVLNVMNVYPSVDTLPNNLLKFYIQFSVPMAEGHAYEHLSIVDEATGMKIEDPFVVMEPELWDPENRRFTLLFDPGRIKRSVKLNLEMGPPLQAGSRYRLVIDRNWPSARGDTLQADFVKAFYVTEADREMPQTNTWVVESPGPQSRQPLILRFPEPLDRALLQRVIQVYDASGTNLGGQIQIGRGERQWSFTPARPWSSGTYEIRVQTILEDVSGNTLHSLFDVDLRTAASSEVREAVEHETLFFEVEGAHIPDA